MPWSDPWAPSCPVEEPPVLSASWKTPCTEAMCLARGMMGRRQSCAGLLCFQGIPGAVCLLELFYPVISTTSVSRDCGFVYYLSWLVRYSPAFLAQKLAYAWTSLPFICADTWIWKKSQLNTLTIHFCSLIFSQNIKEERVGVTLGAS